MGGVPRNPAPGNHFLAWIVKPSGCHCTDAFGGKTYRGVPTPHRSTSPFSEGRPVLRPTGHGAGGRAPDSGSGLGPGDRGLGFLGWGRSPKGGGLYYENGIVICITPPMFGTIKVCCRL